MQRHQRDMTGSWVLPVVGWLVFGPHVCQALTYTCYPNGTLLVNNPDPVLYDNFLVTDDDGACVSEWISSPVKYQLKIDGCHLNADVTVTFTNHVADDNILGGATVQTTQIRCNQIHQTGHMHEITQGVTQLLSSERIPELTPTLNVESALRSISPMGKIQTSAEVGDMLFWTVDIPMQYTMVPTVCTVYPDLTMSTPNKVIITHGCTADKDLMGNFSIEDTYTLVHITRYYNQFWTFKFAVSPIIFINCLVKFCPPGSSACNLDCSPNAYRKRRDTVANTDGVQYGSYSSLLEVKESASSGANGVITIDSSNLWVISVIAVIVFWPLF